MQAIQNALSLKMKHRKSYLLLHTVYAHLASGLYVIHSRKYAQFAQIRKLSAETTEVKVSDEGGE